MILDGTDPAAIAQAAAHLAAGELVAFPTETVYGLGADAASDRAVAGIFAAIPYCLDLIGAPFVDTHEAVCKAFRPKSAPRPAG